MQITLKPVEINFNSAQFRINLDTSEAVLVENQSAARLEGLNTLAGAQRVGYAGLNYWDPELRLVSAVSENVVRARKNQEVA
jgi:hypothetical protein